MTQTEIESLRASARDAVDALRGMASDSELASAKLLVKTLRDRREYALMVELAEQVSRREPENFSNRRLYAQGLIEQGFATAAIDVLQALLKQLPKDHAEALEAIGLLGRANKQIFVDAGDKGNSAARAALKKAIDWYRKPWDATRSCWHGVNLVALLSRARLLGMQPIKDLKPSDVAQQLIATLEKVAEAERDPWFFAMMAEASLGLGDWNTVHQHMNAYVTTKDVQAFHIAGTLRQLTEVWNIEQVDPRGRALADILRARQLQLEDGCVVLEPEKIQELHKAEPPKKSQLEAVLGRNGPQTYTWWKTGLSRALGVASIREKLGGRIGTGFLVRAGNFDCEPADELMVLTNFHVVNDEAEYDAIQPEQTEVVFEAVDATKVYGVKNVEWCSRPDVLDASLLRLTKSPKGIEPLPLAKKLPVLSDAARVYVVGHPSGRDLAFSFQDNDLIDHEGPKNGKPQIPGAIRVHYRTPTEGGSSGSPVFDARLWEVVALHHKGGTSGMPQLNGKPGTYGANEGIAIQSIVAGAKARGKTGTKKQKP